MSETDCSRFHVLAVDLDGYLRDHGDVPLQDAIDWVNKQFEVETNFIVIHTARSYSIFHETRRWLLDNRVNHHALVMEKVRATAYYDDRNAVR